MLYNYRFSDGLHWQLSKVELALYRDRCLGTLPTVAPLSHRISSLLWLGIWAIERRYGVAPDEVLQAILEVENGEAPTGAKPATPFRRLPLLGLWHKHWFSARFLPANLLAAMEREGGAKWLAEVVREGEVIDHAAIERIAHRFTTVAFESRWAAKQVTGEWIVYIQRPDGKYYLCVATHEAGDQVIYDNITAVCVHDYPALMDWLCEARIS